MVHCSLPFSNRKCHFQTEKKQGTYELIGWWHWQICYTNHTDIACGKTGGLLSIHQQFFLKLMDLAPVRHIPAQWGSLLPLPFEVVELVLVGHHRCSNWVHLNCKAMSMEKCYFNISGHFQDLTSNMLFDEEATYFDGESTCILFGVGVSNKWEKRNATEKTRRAISKKNEGWT